jgi:SAM-dependent methyltransferase
MLSLKKQNELRELYRRKNPGWQPATELYAGWVREGVRRESRVLDLGCGRGGLLEQLEHPLSQVVGLDPDWASLAAHRLPALPRAAGWSDALPFAPASFDLIFCSWVLEHLEKPLETFMAIGRVLRSGGRFVFITPNGRHPLALGNRLLGGLGRVQDRLVEGLYGRVAADTFPTYYRANRRRQLSRLAQMSGLTLHRLQTMPDPTYLAFTPLLFQLSSGLEKLLPDSMQIHLVGELVKNDR